MKRILFTVSIVLIAVIIACKKEDTITTNNPTLQLTTLSIGNLTLTSAASGGVFVSYGKDSISEKGVCWSTAENPTVADSKTIDGSGAGNFVSTMTGLTPMTYYFVRSYATSSAGTVYGNQIKFITSLTPTQLPFLTTKDATNVTNTSAISGGTIVSDSGYAVTARGVCWNTSSSPTLADSFTVNGTGIGTFSSTIPDLQQAIIYHVRAYATNAAGTAYGNEITFSTADVTSAPPTVTTSPITTIAGDHADGGGNVTDGGGTPVIARGICWATHAAPTLSDKNTVNGTGIGAFFSTAAGLKGSTTYHLRAYATNTAGTAYGNELTFTTTAATLATLTTNNAANITSTTATSGGNISTDGGSPVTLRGVCWNTSPSPTIGNSKTTNGTGIGTFTSSMTGLASGTTFYLRAYATNGVGTAYGNEVTFVTLASGCGTTVTDIEGNIYGVVQIGAQCWTRPNLRVTKFNNGDPIPNITSNPQWASDTAGAYSFYNNTSPTSATGATYGPLYNWFAITDSRKVCPAGWHIPSKSEWTVLINFLGGQAVAAKELKETGTSHWYFGSAGSNSSAFTALPGSNRNSDGSFPIAAGSTLGYTGVFWSSSADTLVGNAHSVDLSNASDAAARTSVSKKRGESVRCIKN